MSKNNQSSKKKPGTGTGPVKSEYIRFSNTRAIQLKLWGPQPSVKYEGIMPAYVEIEEISFTGEGEPPKYGPSVRIPAKGDAFMMIAYLTDLLKNARTLNREARKSRED